MDRLFLLVIIGGLTVLVAAFVLFLHVV